VFLGEPEVQQKRLRHRALLLVGVLALVGIDCAARVARQTEITAVSNTVGKPRPVLAVDGGHPLFLQPPPDIAASKPLAAGSSAPRISLPAYGIPVSVFSSYLRAADSLAVSAPSCRLTWPVLAGIGRVESNHARNGDVAPNGDMVHPIFGPPLNGSNGTATTRDQNGNWVRAVGPMQFLPSTWVKWGADGNGDGRTDPENVFDASLAAGRYLCADSSLLSTSGGLHDALLRYNNSEKYADTVTQWIRAYEDGGVPVPDQPNNSLSAADSESAQQVSYSDTPPTRQNPRTPSRDEQPPSGHSGASQPLPPEQSGGQAPPPPDACSSVVPTPSPGTPSKDPVPCLVDRVLEPVQTPATPGGALAEGVVNSPAA
jgi:hypothetical protein